MVVVYGQICVKRGLFGAFVIFGTIDDVGYNRSFEVNVEREFEYVANVVLFFFRIIVDICFYSESISRVVFEVVFENAEINVER